MINEREGCRCYNGSPFYMQKYNFQLLRRIRTTARENNKSETFSQYNSR